MNKQIRRSLLSAATLALTIDIGLSSCSKAPEQNAAGPSTSEQAATQLAASEQDATTTGQSADNAKALLKAMSD